MGSAVAKSFLVLEAVSSANRPVRLSSLAEELELQKSTVHRVLAELVELGYVGQDESTGLYHPRCARGRSAPPSSPTSPSSRLRRQP